ncbi:MAG: hypothetical protein LBR11_10425 [Deltaproteobacteria bacterium]|jgi:lipopolysaccharide export system protein LptA|nr:hypothetical protein [Deltaproteobacteria bacterium]
MKRLQTLLCLALTIPLGLGLIWAEAWAAPSPAPSSRANPGETPRDGPISISADHMTANDNAKVVTFSGRVIARQDDLIITCDTMRVHYQPRSGQPGAQAAETEPAAASPTEATDPVEPEAGEGQDRQASSNPALSGGQEIERVECEGTVKIQQGDRLAVGQKAIYLAKSKPRRLILTGDARVWQGHNAVTGHEVTYFLDENRSQVESQNNSRVRAYYEREPQKGPKK